MEALKMKRILTPILLFTFLTVMCGLYTGCKKSQDTVQYLLTVIVSTGVTGTPQSGESLHNLDDKVDYSYTLDEGYTNLKVTLDDEEIAASGTITISRNHTLKAYASQGTGDYLLTVSVATGAVGTPEEGFYYYNAGDQVDYNYSLEAGYTNLVVKFDGQEVASTGTITISDDHTLYVFTETEYYIQGSWTLQEFYNDQSAFNVTVTFTGETRTGTVVDSDGGVGTYTVDGKSVEFTLVFPEVTYVYTGEFTDEENMRGDARRYTSPGSYSSGTWAAVKNTDGSRSMRVSFSSNKKGGH
jgi:hypothetical protein